MKSGMTVASIESLAGSWHYPTPSAGSLLGRLFTFFKSFKLFVSITGNAE